MSILPSMLIASSFLARFDAAALPPAGAVSKVVLVDKLADDDPSLALLMLLRAPERLRGSSTRVVTPREPSRLSLKALTVTGSMAGVTRLGRAALAIFGRFWVLEDVDLDVRLVMEDAFEDCGNWDWDSEVAAPDEEFADVGASEEGLVLKVELVAPLSPLEKDEAEAFDVMLTVLELCLETPATS